MANEITESVSLALSNVNLKFQIPLESKSITQSTALVLSKVITVTTSEADIDTTGISTLGVMYVKNLDTTNYVKLGPKSGGAMVEMMRIKPGEENMFRVTPGITMRWIADTAACQVYIAILND